AAFRETPGGLPAYARVGVAQGANLESMVFQVADGHEANVRVLVVEQLAGRRSAFQRPNSALFPSPQPRHDHDEQERQAQDDRQVEQSLPHTSSRFCIAWLIPGAGADSSP